MSKRKRDVSFIKPDEPAFIARMKEQCGYKEGPSVETKFQQDSHSDSDIEERDDEKPTIVVLKSGDLTAEEAAVAQAKLEEAPANLSDRIIFSKRAKTKKAESDEKGPVAGTDQPKSSSKDSDRKTAKVSKDKSGSKKVKSESRNLLSFTEDDGEEI